MAISRTLLCLVVAFASTAAVPARAADSAATPASAAPPGGSPEAAKLRREAERQRLIAKLRDEAPSVRETPAKASPLELPIFHRHDRP